MQIILRRASAPKLCEGNLDGSGAVTDLQAATHRVAGIFRDLGQFEAAVDALHDAGFADSQISVLGSAAALHEEYGRHVPPAEDLADRPDAPRETLESESALKQVLHFLGETAATISLLVVAGAAFFVGGPIGVASQASDCTDLSIEASLDGFIDDAYAVRFKQKQTEGGLVCWVDAVDAETMIAAVKLLETAGADHVHEVPAGSPAA
jgi:hypothetical protein